MARFKKGGGGNPTGRKPGSLNKTTRAFREAVTAAFNEIGGTSHLVAWAKKNPGAFYQIATRLVPAGSPVHIGPLKGGITDQADAIMKKMCEGAISPEQAGSVMQVLVAKTRIIEVDELEQRVKTLEEKQNAKP